MQRSSQQLIWLGLTFGVISIIYFFSLIFHLPVVATAILIIIAGYFSYKYVVSKAEVLNELSRKEQYRAFAILAIGLFLLVNKSFYLVHKYGDWDAWAIWNFHAVFLKDPAHWREYLGLLPAAHPDYPLLVPSSVAFFWRLFQTDTPVIPFALSMMVTIVIPVILYLQFYRRNLPLAALVLILFVTDEFYIQNGLSQYADIYLSFFLLCSFICLEYFRKEGSPKYLLLTGAFLGCCLWTKNEGLMLAAVFILFHFRLLFSLKNLRVFAAGILIPLISLIVFKMFYAPPNDLVRMTGASQLDNLTDDSRYKLIYETLMKELRDNFLYCKIAFGLYLLFCVIKKTLPDRNFLLIIGCVFGYFLVFLITPRNLEWQLNTSIGRLLLHLAPSFLFIVCLKLSQVKLSVS